MSDGVVQVSAEVEQDCEGEGVEVLLPVEATEGAEVEADQLVLVQRYKTGFTSLSLMLTPRVS